MKIKTSAPGKLMLFGEHAVIHQHPCLVTAVDLRIQVSIEKIETPMIFIETPRLHERGQDYSLSINDLFNDQQLHPQTKFIVASIRKVFSKYNLHHGLRIQTSGPLNSYGLGSSSAVTVATIYALINLFEIVLNKQRLFDLAYSAVLEVQHLGSGFDVASAIYGETLFYTPGQEVEILPLEQLPIVMAYSGAKVSTTRLVEEVEQLRSQFPEIIDPVFKSIGNIATSARYAILQNNWSTAGKLANINQGLLESLGVSTPSLQKPIMAARKSGSFGAKLSGAGGGDCMFAIISQETRSKVEAAIENSGAQVLHFAANVEGVRLEIEHL
ncbi:MAG: mevalonate kinase [Chloroflexota bacterium]